MSAIDPAEFPPHTLPDWRDQALRELRGKGTVEALTLATDSGVPIPPLCVRQDVAGLPHLATLPGQAPYLRGGVPEAGWRSVARVEVDEPDAAAAAVDAALAAGFDGVRLCLPGDGDPQVLERGLAGVDPSRVLLSVPAVYLHRDFLPWITARDDGLRYLPDHLLEIQSCTASQQLAHMAAHLVWTLRSFRPEVQEGSGGPEVPPAAIAARYVMGFPITHRLLPAVAKLRAARLLWSRILRAFDITGPPAPRLHGVTSRYTWTRYDLPTNLVRTALQAFVATASGCDTVEVTPHEGPDVAPGSASSRLALGQLRLLRHESHLDAVADPLGGAYAVEDMTQKLAARAFGMLRRIEGAGGFGRCLNDESLASYVDRDASESARARRVALREDVLVGINRHADPSRDADVAPRGSGAAGGGLGEAFERLRDRAAAHARATGRALGVLLSTAGDPAVTRARAEFASDLFRAGGFRVGIIGQPREPGFHPDVVAACGSDGVPGVIPAVSRPIPVFVVGAPPAVGEPADPGLLHPGMDAVAFLTGVLDRLGVAP